ncbi:UDP-N-acetylmuramate dehydrogenase [Mangrovicoccus ximenensis]|uniref:UDP-N-acetylmuramate dehydrogenase n=1 Tax=Mangrovicoccus ximenensis TaxID=1911570 RepID=UPI000D3A9CDA|nr:UDP-N-acetylmuramate dehydrogenase [Mangrovicoccus ximenensis]
MESNRPLAPLTWLRCGGPAETFFQPKDLDDLCATLAGLDPATPVFPLGLGSNLIVRDGGIRGLVIRLGRGFNGMEFSEGRAVLGAAVPDAQAAKRAAAAGLDLTFLRTIPGSIGGAARMNAGCYGAYLADHFVEAQAVTRQGEVITLAPQDMGFAYRHTELPPDLVITRVTLSAEPGDPEALMAKMEEQLAKRDASQPTKDRTAGSTFRNPAGFSSTGRADDTHELKAWKLIDEAGMRGAVLGGAQMSPMHSNFLVNAGGATAADLEGLGELVRKKVWDFHGIELVWEVQRVGDPLPVHPEVTND